MAKTHLFVEEEIVFAQALAEQITISLENARLHEEQYQRAREFEALFDTMVNGIIVYDANMQVVKVNRSATRILKIAPDNQNNLSERIKTYNMRRLDGTPFMAQEMVLYRSVMLGEVVSDFDVLLDGESGPNTTINCSSSPLRDENGVIRGAIVVFLNVTDQRRIQLESLRVHSPLLAAYFS